MNTQLARALDKINEHHWLRMLVCFSPGIVFNKIATSFDAPPSIKLASMIVLVVGIGIYVKWTYMLKKLFGIDDEGTVDSEHEEQSAETANKEEVATGINYVHIMNELVHLCKGNAHEALQLVSIECEVNPNYSYLTAIETAYRRKYHTSPNQSRESAPEQP